MAPLEKLTKTDALIMIYNQCIQQLTASQLDEKVMREMESLSVTVNPELHKNILSTQDAIGKLKRTLAMLEEMIELEGGKKAKVRISN